MLIDRENLDIGKVVKACGIIFIAVLWVYLNFYFHELAVRLEEEDRAHPFLGIAKNTGPVSVYFCFFFMAMTPGSVGIVLFGLGYVIDWWLNRDIRKRRREAAARREAKWYTYLQN